MDDMELFRGSLKELLIKFVSGVSEGIQEFLDEQKCKDDDTKDIEIVIIAREKKS